MKKFRHIAFTFAVVLGLAFSVSAQKDDQKKPPKNPPVIKPGDKPPKGNPPKEKPGRPGMAFIVTPSRDEKLG